MKVNMRETNETFLKSIPVKDKQPAPKIPEKTDKITIGAQEPKPDIQFIDALKSRILNEVKAGTDVSKLNDLKKQIQAGSYDINPADIARKITLT